MNFEKIAFQTEEVAKLAGAFIASQVNQLKTGQVEVKGEHNYVTFVDKESERIIVEGLTPLINSAVFLTEEATVESRAGEWQWIVDPLDGTTNFIHGLPLFSVSIALVQNANPVVGVVYEVNSGECFTAWANGPALLNGNQIGVSNCQLPDSALLATGFPYYDYNLLDQYLQLFADFMKNTRGLRRLGSAAVDLAWVAAGRFDAFYEYGLNPWDVAAGALLVKQAGGKVSHFDGSTNYLHGKRILASNGQLHETLLKTIGHYFPPETSIL